MRRALLLLLAAGLAGPAAAHDTWFSPGREAARDGGARVALTTGNRFPVQDFNPGADSLVRAQCDDGQGSPLPLRPVRDQDKWLDLAAAPRTPGWPVLACWAELKAYELTGIRPEVVQLYFDEIRASAAVRAAWAAMQTRQVAWQESYRKFARIELAIPGATPQRLATARAPAGMDLEIVVLGGQPLAVGQELAFQVLRDGEPLAGFPVEMASERSRLGIWRVTDADGRVRYTLPFGGRWLLRGTDLRPVPGDTWVSRFATLAFELVSP